MSAPGVPTAEQLREGSERLRVICEDLRRDIQPPGSTRPVALGELIACSAEKKTDGKRLGINHLRWAILAATAMNNL